MPTYQRSQLYVDARRDAAGIQNIEDLANRAVRTVVEDIDLRSMKRMAYLSPYLNEEQWDYAAPTDLKDTAIVDIRRIANRTIRNKFNMANTEYFDRNKTFNKNLVCVEEASFLTKLRISARLDETGQQAVLNEADSITDNGTWAASSNASNLTRDTEMFIYGDASLNFDMAISYTSGLLTNPDMDAVDLSDFETGGSVYAYVYIPTAGALTGLHNTTPFKLRVGSSASDYFEQTLTQTNEEIAFSVGWNLLRFDFSSATEAGTVDMDNINYLRLEVLGDGTAATATENWRLNYIVARRGVPHQIWYYTLYGWQNTSGTYLANSTAATDYLNVDGGEYQLIVAKLKELIAEDLEFEDKEDRFAAKYEKLKAIYLDNYKSERLLVVQTNWNFGNDLSDIQLS